MSLKPACESLIKQGWKPKFSIETGLDTVIDSIIQKEFSIQVFLNALTQSHENTE
jgi:hypothetical protein